MTASDHRDCAKCGAAAAIVSVECADEMIRAAVEAEREGCAEVADAWAGIPEAAEIALEIRSRGEVEG